MEVKADDVADVVLKTFDSLEKKRKPIVRGPGVQEWVPLSGIVAQGQAPWESHICQQADHIG